jgi:hypothetical protein
LPYQIEYGSSPQSEASRWFIVLDRSHPISTILILDNTDATFGQRINYVFDDGWIAVDPTFESICPGFDLFCELFLHSLGIFLSLMAWAYIPKCFLARKYRTSNILEGSNSSLHWFRLIASYRLGNHCDWT